MSKKQKNFIIGLVLVFVLSLSLLFSNNSSKLISSSDNSISPKPDLYQEEVMGESTIEESKTPSIEPLITPEIIDSSDSQAIDTYMVVKVIDGDTIDVNIEGVKTRLRLIGLDTPETVDPRKPVQCFGKEASNKAKEILTGQFVRLEFDDSQGDKDKYGRLLRYVFLPDGSNYNLYMIQNGYAHEYTYKLPYKYQTEFKQAEEDARNNNLGLWSPDTCSGNK